MWLVMDPLRTQHDRRLQQFRGTPAITAEERWKNSSCFGFRPGAARIVSVFELTGFRLLEADPVRRPRVQSREL